MTIDLHSYRLTLLRAIESIRAIQSAVHIHLIYTPELQDPLNLIDDTRREMALVRAPTYLKAIEPEIKNAPRLVTLDCRRVAAYLLETDPGLDDPAFEHSISHSHAETCLAQSHDSSLNNDEHDFSKCAIGGWLIAGESAGTLAARLNNFSIHQRSWVRWTHPSVLGALWPSMSAEQRFMLLGDATWLVFDSNGSLQQYASTSGTTAATAPIRAAMESTPRLEPQQMHRLRNVPLVRDLNESWKRMSDVQAKVHPANAEQQLHALVGVAQQAGLDAESVAIYAMTAVQLRHSATGDAEWTELVSHAASNGLPLCDLLSTLSASFWDSYSLLEREGNP